MFQKVEILRLRGKLKRKFNLTFSEVYKLILIRTPKDADIKIIFGDDISDPS